MKILIDAFGGDNSPIEPIRGAVMAKRNHKVDVALVGNSKRIARVAKNNNIDITGITVYHADDVIKMKDSPITVRNKPESSLRVGFELLKNGTVDAFISAGNTGALHMGASMYVGRCENIRRSAIAAILPLETPVLLIDSGANVSPTAEHLLQFAIMGTIYMKGVFGIENPRVGLLNIGAEDHKGTDLHKQTYQLLKSTSSVNFVGNVEGNVTAANTCDVLVADGFSGNVLLKTVEGMGKLLFSNIKQLYVKNIFTKASYLLIKDHMLDFKEKFSASTYGGAPILGISKPIIKAHGNADAITFNNAVKQACSFIDRNVIDSFTVECSKLK